MGWESPLQKSHPLRSKFPPILSLLKREIEKKKDSKSPVILLRTILDLMPSQNHLICIKISAEYWCGLGSSNHPNHPPTNTLLSKNNFQSSQSMNPNIQQNLSEKKKKWSCSLQNWCKHSVRDGDACNINNGNGKLDESFKNNLMVNSDS